jgi:hypothetical protein
MTKVFSQVSNALEGALSCDAAAMTFAQGHLPSNTSAGQGPGIFVQRLDVVYRQPFSRLYVFGESHVYFVAGRTRGTASLERVFGLPPMMNAFWAAVDSNQRPPTNTVDFATLDPPAGEIRDGNSNPVIGQIRTEDCAVKAVGSNVSADELCVCDGSALEFADLKLAK